MVLPHTNFLLVIKKEGSSEMEAWGPFCPPLLCTKLRKQCRIVTGTKTISEESIELVECSEKCHTQNPFRRRLKSVYH